MRFCFLLFLLLFAAHLPANTEDVPVLFQGRHRPMESYARLWLAETYHAQNIKSEHRQTFASLDGSPIDLLWKMHLLGHEPWDNAPFFWIQQAELKRLLGLDERQDRFSYNTLHQAIYENEETNLALMKRLIHHSFLQAYNDPTNRSRSEKLELSPLSPGLWATIQQGHITIAAAPKTAPWNFLRPGMKIASFGTTPESSDKKLSQDILGLFNALKKYTQTDELLRVLPQKQRPGEWVPLHQMGLSEKNFTPYPDNQFALIRSAYNALKPFREETFHLRREELAYLLNTNYTLLAGTSFREAEGKGLSYPSVMRLRAEVLYYQIPFLPITIGLYGIATLLFILSLLTKRASLSSVALVVLWIAFTLHTVVLAMRCYILGRPPVSNMFETVIYVPWIAVLTSLILRFFFKHALLLTASCVGSLALLILLQVTQLSSSMENVQAVLDSQYWLLIHVLMVVGSYGIFVLSGVLGHFYIGGLLLHKRETETLQFMARWILQSMYLGTALLVCGTILGGIWAAESWGRFWDWDPKESWAFISSGIYVIWVHAYRFRLIGNFGLAVGAICGLLAISFTWYGVNYILGTGLHSYGWGNGGEVYYYAFLVAEIVFLSFASLKRGRGKREPMGKT